LGDRRDHFEAETDVWEIAMRIAAGRKEREIDPAIAALRACIAEATADARTSPIAAKRLKEMLAFTETAEGWYAQVPPVPRAKLAAWLRLGVKVITVLPTGKSR